MSKSSLFTILLAASLASMWTPARAGDAGLTYDQVLQQASERNVPVVLDFFTDWCVYCKHFDHDRTLPDNGLQKALDGVAFTSIDAEKGEGIELAKKYGVSSYPTYLVVNSEGELMDRWSGYGGPDHFLGQLEPALADPTTEAQKQARFDKNPTADDAQKLAEFANGRGEYVHARDLYHRAEELDPSRDLSGDVLYSGYTQFRKDDAFDADAFVELVGSTLDAKSDADSWSLALSLTNAVASRAGKPALVAPVVKGAVAARDAGVAFDDAAAKQLEVLSLLHLQDKPEEAAQLKKTTMKEGWMDDANSLNSYAWWCFENRVNLEEAQKLAARGIELAEPGSDKAMILDTAAEICNALGNCGQSVAYIKEAIAQDPDRASYHKQLERFQKLLEESE
jgi:thiol-disulfide isomerase/thioredoxin